MARSTNRLVFLEMGRDGCGNCEALKNKVIEDPGVKSEMGRLCVGWYDNVDRERATPARSILYQNLPNAMVLPLVGWVTSDMRWISGYSGRRDAAGFSNEIAKARAIYLQRTAADRPVPERELVVEPEHGSLPDTELADVGAALGDDAIPVAAEVAVERTPFAEEGARLDAPVAAAEPPVAATPPAPPEPETVTAPAPPPPAPTETVPVAPAPDPVRAWAHQELVRAASALAARDYAGARAILAEVRTRAQGLPEQREAEKGEVAIHLLKKIERQSGDEASKTRSDAARDLRGTVWVSLFA